MSPVPSLMNASEAEGSDLACLMRFGTTITTPARPTSMRMMSTKLSEAPLIRVLPCERMLLMSLDCALADRDVAKDNMAAEPAVTISLDLFLICCVVDTRRDPVCPAR